MNANKINKPESMNMNTDLNVNTNKTKITLFFKINCILCEFYSNFPILHLILLKFTFLYEFSQNPDLLLNFIRNCHI